MTYCHYAVPQLLQNVTFITKWDKTRLPKEIATVLVENEFTTELSFISHIKKPSILPKPKDINSDLLLLNQDNNDETVSTLQYSQ